MDVSPVGIAAAQRVWEVERAILSCRSITSASEHPNPLTVSRSYRKWRERLKTIPGCHRYSLPTALRISALQGEVSVLAISRTQLRCSAHEPARVSKGRDQCSSSELALDDYCHAAPGEGCRLTFEFVHSNG